MGIYHGVKKVQELGKLVEDFEKPIIVSENERLIAVIGDGVSKKAPDVTDSEDLRYFRDKYYHGDFTSFKLYLLTADSLVLCPDMGRLYEY